MHEGDIVDKISVERTTVEEYTIGRVKVLEIGETTKKGNYKVKLLRAKVIVIPKAQYKQSLVCEEEF